MEALLKVFPLGMFFRGLLPGVFFALAYRIASGGLDSVLFISDDELLKRSLPLAIFSGITFYIFHRAVVHPAALDFFFDRDSIRQFRQRHPFITQRQSHWYISRWRMGMKNDKAMRRMADHLSTWAVLTHFLYVSCWCLLAGLTAGGVVKLHQGGDAIGWITAALLLLLAALFILGAVYSDWRLQTVSSACIAVANDPRADFNRRSTGERPTDEWVT